MSMLEVTSMKWKMLSMMSMQMANCSCKVVAEHNVVGPLLGDVVVDAEGKVPVES